MTQSTFASRTPYHTAIIMDGNGRWARQRGLPRTEGHRRGVEAVRRVVEAAPELGIRFLTVYAFSSDNWKRPPEEVHSLFGMLEHFLRGESERCREEGIEIRVVGRRDRLPWTVVQAIRAAEKRTRGGERLTFRVAVDYSAREVLVRAARGFRGMADHAAFTQWMARVQGEDGREAPDVDLLIRTSGEQRLSDFLLWESAYAELYFTPQAWPDFDGESLRAAVEEYRRRVRRFGGLTAESPMDSDESAARMKACAPTVSGGAA
jgi:undecaprenyl diphosphate synthase